VIPANERYITCRELVAEQVVGHGCRSCRYVAHVASLPLVEPLVGSKAIGRVLRCLTPLRSSMILPELLCCLPYMDLVFVPRVASRSYSRVYFWSSVSTLLGRRGLWDIGVGLGRSSGLIVLHIAIRQAIHLPQLLALHMLGRVCRITPCCCGQQLSRVNRLQVKVAFVIQK